MENATIGQLRARAGSQHGLFTAGQAAVLGVPPAALYQAVERGWLRRARRGVYAFAGRLPDPWEPLMAVALAAGPDAVISHGAAAALHGFWGIAPSHLELTMPGKTRHILDGAKIHRSDGFAPGDVQRRGAVRLTAPIRTLLDTAPSLNDYVLPRLIDEGSISRLWTPERIAARLDQPCCPRRDIARVRQLLETRMEEGHPANGLERRIIRVVKGQVPPYEVHHQIELEGRLIEMDIAWPDYLIDAEVEGRHVRMASRTKFEADRLRSNLLQRHHWRQVQLTAGMSDRTILAQLVPLFPREVIDPRVWAEAHRDRGRN